MSACSCGNPIGPKNKTGQCRSCRMKEMRADPAFEKHRAEAFRHALNTDAALRAKHAARSRVSLAKWRDTPEGQAKMRANARKATVASNTPEARARRSAAVQKARTGWCPADRRDEYLKARTQVGAAEAKRMILADIAAKERARLAAMTPFERQMDALARGATLTTKPVMRKADHAFSLTGSSMG